MVEYLVVGDSDRYKECLIYICTTKESAEKILQRILTNPNDNDKFVTKGLSNLRIAEVEGSDCWWHGEVD